MSRIVPPGKATTVTRMPRTVTSGPETAMREWRDEEVFTATADCAVRWATPDRVVHRHTFAELVLVVAGTGTHRCGGRSQTIATGDVFFIPPGVVHAYEPQPGLVIINLLWRDAVHHGLLPCLQESDWWSGLLQDLPGQARRLRPDAGAQVHDALERLADELAEPRPLAELAIPNRFHRILIALARQADVLGTRRPPGTGLATVLSRLHADPAMPVDLDRWADWAGLPRRTFLRRFKTLTGLAPGAYLEELRLAAVRRLLCDSDQAITSIALACGFCDGNHLARRFRARFGCSPRDFRRGGDAGGSRASTSRPPMP